jgi:molecular chaperone DnaK (HSP70)
MLLYAIIASFPTEIKVGYDAMPYLSSNPDNTIYNAKRFIGRRWVHLVFFYTALCLVTNV